MENHCQRRKIFEFLSQFTLEPVFFAYSFGLRLFTNTQTTVIYNKVCYQYYYGQVDVNCHNLSATPFIENKVQENASLWNLGYSLSWTLPALPCILLWSSWGDRHDSKIPIMVAMTGIILGIFNMVSQSALPELPLWVMVLIGPVCGLTGTYGVFLQNVFKYISDATDDPNFVATRFAILWTVFGIGAIGAGSVGSVTIRQIGITWTLVIAEALQTISFFCIIVLIKGSYNNSSLRRKDAMQNPDDSISDEKDESDGKHRSFLGVISQLAHDSSVVLTRPREGNKRLYLWLTLLLFLVISSADMGESATQNLFMYHDPLSFTAASFSQYQSVQAATALVAQLMVTAALKYWHFSDCFLIIISLLSNVAKLVVLAVSSHNWMVWLAGGVGCITMVAMSATLAFLVSLVDSAEKGKALAMCEMVRLIGYLISVSAYGYIYDLSVSWYPGFVFAIAAALLGTMLLMQAWIFIDIKRNDQSACIASEQQIAEA